MESREPFWPALAAVVGALGLCVTLPHRLTMGPSWAVPILEALLLASLALTTPLGLLVHFLLAGGARPGRIYSSPRSRSG
jgi:hypothetical protein